MKNFLKKLLSRITRSKQGECSICNNLFKDNELTLIDDLSFCPDHIKTYKESSWKEVKVVSADPTDPRMALILTDNKNQLHELNIPSFIKTTYKISNDQIISTFHLFVRSEDEYKVTRIIF